MAKKKKEPILIDDVSRQIAETKKILADAQKSLAEKTAEVSNLKARLKQLEKSANLPEDSKSFTGKWFKSEDGTSADKYCTNYYYVIKDYGYKAQSDGTVYRKLTVFNLSMDLWECKSLCDSVMVYQEISQLYEPGELDHLIPVKTDEIKNSVLKNFRGMFKILSSKNILPEEFKPLIAQKKKVKKND
jgi:hypothetical protein